MHLHPKRRLLLAYLGFVITVAALACAGWQAVARRKAFGKVVWQSSGVRSREREDFRVLYGIREDAEEIAPSDVYFIWERLRHCVPSFRPVCISRTDKYYVLSGGSAPWGDIWNSGVLLVRRTDGFVWDQVHADWRGSGFTALSEEELARRIVVGQVTNVMGILGPPVSKTVDKEKMRAELMYFTKGGGALFVTLAVDTFQVVDMCCTPFFFR